MDRSTLFNIATLGIASFVKNLKQEYQKHAASEAHRRNVMTPDELSLYQEWQNGKKAMIVGHYWTPHIPCPVDLKTIDKRSAPKLVR